MIYGHLYTFGCAVAVRPSAVISLTLQMYTDDQKQYLKEGLTATVQPNAQ